MRAESQAYAEPGYKVYEEGGRLWVFRAGGAPLAGFLAHGEPAKRVTLIGAGPDGKTLLGAEKPVLEEYAASKRYASPGFVVIADGGRLWVFRAGSAALGTFRAQGEPAKRVTLIGAGPDGKTLLGAEKSVLEAYVAAVAGR